MNSVLPQDVIKIINLLEEILATLQRLTNTMYAVQSDISDINDR